MRPLDRDVSALAGVLRTEREVRVQVVGLFADEAKPDAWSCFVAAGFDRPVSGFIHRATRPSCGMPLGGIDTGCLDIEATGLLGMCSIFNSHVPRRGPLNEPFLGMKLEGRTWVLSTVDFGLVSDAVDWYSIAASPPTGRAKGIRYWGHYPVLDMEFEADAPVAVGLRAWTPFIPGDLTASCVPAAVFEVHLRNTSDRRKDGTLAFSFPGPAESELGALPARRRSLAEDGLHGIVVEGELASYVLALMGSSAGRVGGALGCDTGAWGRIDHSLPTARGATGSSLAVPFTLDPGEHCVLRFLVAWHSAHWFACGHPDPQGRALLPFPTPPVQEGEDARGPAYRHMYSLLYKSAERAACFVAQRHEELLARVLHWQQAIYDEDKLPVWLRESLINILHLFTETSFWAAAQAPIGPWCFPDDGLFGLNEDPRHCPQIECVPCSFYGNYPLVYFFPELARSTLRGYRAYQYPDGQVAWIFGGSTAGSLPVEMASPTRGYQTTLNGPCVVDMVYRYWLCTGDDAFLREMYDMVKGAIAFTMQLRSEDGDDGIISFPTGNSGTEWFEHCTWAGMAAHVGGIHLASLRQAEAVAHHLGDERFAQQCGDWFERGQAGMENKLWVDGCYLNYLEPASGKRSDLVMANQLDGQWMAHLAGVGGVFAPARVLETLGTVGRTCVAATPFGAVNFARRDGQPEANGGLYHPYAMFPPEVVMLGATYMYAGQRALGLDLCRRCWENIVRQGRTWDQPNIVRGDTGEVVYGGDYYQNLILWTLPAALAGTNIAGPCQPGGVVQRVLLAGGVGEDLPHGAGASGAGA